jgi:SynChlorMet cassette radical SAM/SPASM protein ScmE
VSPRKPLQTPSSVDIAVTGRCNLACAYCFYADEMNWRDDLSTQDWLRVISRLGGLSVMRVCLTGGEAFTRPDLFEIVDGCIDAGMRYGILTNGTLIDDGVLRKFDKGRRRLRLDYIQVSIDGHEASVHDAMRPGSFDRATAALALLKSEGFPVNVRMTISPSNLGCIEQTAEFLLDGIGLEWFSTNESFRMGAGCDRCDSVLSNPQRLEAMHTFERLLARYPGRIRAQAGPQAKLATYRQMERARSTGELPDSWEMGRLTGCGCVFDRLGIMHDGTIVPCHVLHGLSLGNALTDPIGDIWLGHPVLEALRGRRSIRMADIPACSGCEWAPFCNGSCPGIALEKTGSFDMPNPEDCYARFTAETGVRLRG